MTFYRIYDIILSKVLELFDKIITGFSNSEEISKGFGGFDIEQTINIERMEHALNLFGNYDENIKLIENTYQVSILWRGTEIKVSGEAENVMKASRTINGLLTFINKGEQLSEQNIRYVMSLVDDGNESQISSLAEDCVCITTKGKPIKAKTLGQRQYLESIRNNTISLGVGPAGTGKTYLAVAMAVKAFRNNEVNRIILTRPAVEAGEKLGFLPGDLQNKVDPYLRPLYDALYDFLGMEQFKALSEKGAIEVAPLAYMRGRTLNDAFIILDEAQNCTIEQMKMFLTRFGEGSRVIVTGDITQIDLPRDKASGLVHAMHVLREVEGLEIVTLTHKDVVRHEMVQRIILAYDKAEKRRQERLQEGSRK